MKVLIVGAGNMGRGIATRLAAAKAKLTIYDIDGEKARAIAKDVGGHVTSTPSRELEALAFLGITLQFRLNTGFGTAWKLILPTT